jgi:hypothetical protein
MNPSHRGAFLSDSLKRHSLLISCKVQWILYGGENRSISDDFGDETDTTFVPCILLFSPKGALHIRLGFVFCQSPEAAKHKHHRLSTLAGTAALVINPSFLRMQESRRQWIPAFAEMTVTDS